MFRNFLCVAAALFTFGIATESAAADDKEACKDWRNEEAIAACSRLIDHNPRDATSYNDRANAYNFKGDYDRALSDYNQAIRLDPNNAVAREGRQRVLAALAGSDQTIRRDPKSAEAYNDRANAYNFKGDYDRALSDYNQAIRLDPNNAVAREGRQRVQAALAARSNLAQSTPVPPVQPKPPPQAWPLPKQVSPPASAERRVALVIGNSAYGSSLVQALPNPRRDAKLVADALRQAGFETEELTDLDRVGMAKALQLFRAKADSADWALIYFAGHGIEINRVNFLIPVDAKLTDSRDVKLETVSYEDFAEAIGGAKALRIIILDACRNNPFKAQMQQTLALRGSLDRGLAAPPETEPGTLVVYSAKEGQAALDGDSVNSPFARAFVTELKVPGRDVRRMFDFVRDDVLEATSKHQQPYTYGSLPASRDFFFVAGK